MERNIKMAGNFAFIESCGYKFHKVEVSWTYCIGLLSGNNAIFNQKSIYAEIMPYYII